MSLSVKFHLLKYVFPTLQPCIIILIIILSLHCVTEVVPPSNAAAWTPKQNRSQGTLQKPSHKCSAFDIWLFHKEEKSWGTPAFYPNIHDSLKQNTRRSCQSPSRARVVSVGRCTTRTYILPLDTLQLLPFPYSVSLTTSF